MEIKKELINIIVLGILNIKDYTSIDLYDKMQEIVSISEGSLFKVIKSLEDGNLINGYQVKDGNHMRNMYRITSLGRVRLEQFEKEYDMVIEVYKFLKEL